MRKRQAAKGFAMAFATVITFFAAVGCGLESRGDKSALLLLSIRQENTFATKEAS